MEKEDLIYGEVIQQTGAPAKKVFNITEKGKKALEDWLFMEPELPGFKHEFLVKLSFGARLSGEELLGQLNSYEEKLREKLTALESDKKDSFLAFARSPKELSLWELTFDNGMMYYQNELAWTEKAKSVIENG
jgi:DNA-binding PadR family transcriptional regulator